MVVRHTNTAGTAPGQLAADGQTYTGFGYLSGGAGSDQFTINNNSTLNAWLQPLTGNDSVLLDSGGVVTQFIQAQTYSYEKTLYQIFNNSVAGLTPRQTQITQYLGTGDSNDTVVIDGAGYTGTSPYAITIGTGTASGDDLYAQGGNDNVSIANGVHIAGGVSIGAGQDTLSVGPNVLISGDISAAADNGADLITIAEGATVTGRIELTSGNDTLNIAGKVGDGTAFDRISMGDGNNNLTIASTAVINVSQIVLGSQSSNLTVEEGAQVNLKPGNYAGYAVQLSQGNDNVFLGGTWNSAYDYDVWDATFGDDNITMGADFSATNTGSNSVFKIHAGGNSIALDNDTLNISALLSRVTSWTPNPANPEQGRIILDDGTIIDYSEIENIITCFAGGTLIQTDTGSRCIEDLRVGDLVQTRDNGMQPIRWIGCRKLSAAELAAAPHLRPILIKSGALGRNTPAQDLMVSPQHRILVRSKIAQRMCSSDEVLVAAKHLQDIPGIKQVEGDISVDYYHMLFDRHEIVMSNGAETESLYTGAQALKALGAAARDEILALFPELGDTEALGLRPAARPLLPGRIGRQLAQRHCKNHRALIA